MHTTELRRVDEYAVRPSQLLDLVREAIFIRDIDGVITLWNHGASELYGWTEKEAIGRTPHELLRTRFPRPLHEIEMEVVRQGHWQGELIHTRRDGTSVIVSSRWALQRNNAGEPMAILEINTDVTELKQAIEELRRLSVELLRSQDEERRRIARELHDATGQKLAAVAMHLSAISQSAAALDPYGRKALAESVGLVDRVVKEVRTLSYLLYPPLLDERGLASALRWYVQGFTARSGIQVAVDVPPDDRRLPPQVETVVYRIVQEGLTNVHRHSGSLTAAIRLTIDSGKVHLEVRDKGKGFPHQRADSGPMNPGVGIMSMRERVKQLGGVIDIESSADGTVVCVTLPLPGGGLWQNRAS